MKLLLFNVVTLLLLCVCSCSEHEDICAVPFYLEIDLEDDVVNIPTEGIEEEINIRTNVVELGIIPLSGEEYAWCSLSDVEDPVNGRRLLVLKVQENEDVEKREAAFVISGQGVDNDTIRVAQLGTDPMILTNLQSKRLSVGEQHFILKVTANVPYSVSNTKSWLSLQNNAATRSLVESAYVYKVSASTVLSSRTDTIYVQGKEKGDTILIKIPVEQSPEDLDEMLVEDTKVKVAEAKLVQGKQYGSYGAAKTIDGNLGTSFGSTTESGNPPVIIEYTMDTSVDRVDYILLHQSLSANSDKCLATGRLFYQSADITEWTACGTFDAPEMIQSVRIDVNVQRPTRFRLEMDRSGKNVSLGEFECYQFSEDNLFDLEADARFFEDDVYSKLKPGVTMEDIKNITHPVIRSVAQELLGQTYDTEFRSRTYHSCKNPNTVGSELTIGKRSVCDNPTGLFFKKDEKYVVFVGEGAGNEAVKLYIRDWRNGGKSQTQYLYKGLNVITPSVDGNGYIQYWSGTDEPLPDVNIHVCYGNEIGFWDVRAGHTNADWKRILDKAVKTTQLLEIDNGMMDMLGEYVQMTNTVNSFKKYCQDDIEGAVAMHDELMKIEYGMMGLFKYNAVPRNRMLGVRSWGGNPNWNGTNANYPNKEKSMFDRDAFLKDIWVFGHEFGHGNQVAQMKLPAWNEVTNNVYAQQAMYIMANKGNRCPFDKFIKYSVVEGDEYFANGDPFVLLTPLFQLSLFFTLTESSVPWFRPDFWADIHWGAIQDKTTKNNYGLSYTNFMKRCMDASGYDLRDFFHKMGLLREIHRQCWSYGGAKWVTITKEMVDEVEALGATKEPIPGGAVIHYISDTNIALFNARQAVQGSLGQGVTDDGSSKVISHAVWKNVVAYEVYAGDKLTTVAVSGRDLSENGTTKIAYPAGSTRIEAVAWNGERTLVYGKR